MKHHTHAHYYLLYFASKSISELITLRIRNFIDMVLMSSGLLVSPLLFFLAHSILCVSSAGSSERGSLVQRDRSRSPLPFCPFSAQLDNGHWDISTEFEDTSWERCPGAKTWATNNRQVTYQITYYACSGKWSFHKARYIYGDAQSGCRNWNYKHAVEYISYVFAEKLGSPLVNVFAIGDSIGAQYAIAAKCASEMHSLNETLRVGFWHDHTLRNDVPCSENCTNAEFRSKLFATCSRCAKNGSTVPFQRESELHFANNIPTATNILILTCGVWYNSFKFSQSRPDQLYNTTLHLAAPVLKNLVKRGVIVVWVSLPYNRGGSANDKRLYGWDTFAAKDESAKFFFRDTGVIFVDANPVIGRRISKDPYAFVNGTVHYCNPGSSSVPIFLHEVIMQHVASALYENRVPFYST